PEHTANGELHERSPRSPDTSPNDSDLARELPPRTLPGAPAEAEGVPPAVEHHAVAREHPLTCHPRGGRGQRGHPIIDGLAVRSLEPSEQVPERERVLFPRARQDLRERRAAPLRAPGPRRPPAG